MLTEFGIHQRLESCAPPLNVFFLTKTLRFFRMKWVAAFAVSAYGYCNDRAGHKPFNPLLGETFECVRDDKGFKYIAEQV